MHPLRLQRRNSDCILSLSYAYSNYVKVWGIISLNFDNVLKFCLFNLILYVSSTIFQLNRDGSSWVEFISNVRQLFAADDFSRQHFQMHFFLCALRVKVSVEFLYIHMLAGAGCYYKTRTFPLEETTVLPAKSDSDFMLCLQSHHVLIIDRSLVY